MPPRQLSHQFETINLAAVVAIEPVRRHCSILVRQASLRQGNVHCLATIKGGKAAQGHKCLCEFLGMAVRACPLAGNLLLHRCDKVSVLIQATWYEQAETDTTSTQAGLQLSPGWSSAQYSLRMRWTKSSSALRRWMFMM